MMGKITGTVTEIQRFSLNDGPGIRTTVFLKGCNMRCTWCHNPETLCRTPELLFSPSKCIGCGMCFEVCPESAHTVIDGEHTVDRERCINCLKCTKVCFADACVACGTEMTAEDVIKEVRQDMAYYRQSGGGITLSGGEVLCQSDFAAELLGKCKAGNIHTAIETNMSLPFETVKKVLSFTDFVMCDIKLFDDELHKQYTGISNKTVLENISKLNETGIPFIVRTPIIPEVTDTDGNISAIAEYIKGFKNMQRYELLNFNPLGASKYGQLSKDSPFAAARPLSADRMGELKALAEKSNITVKAV